MVHRLRVASVWYMARQKQNKTKLRGGRDGYAPQITKDLYTGHNSQVKKSFEMGIEELCFSILKGNS